MIRRSALNPIGRDLKKNGVILLLLSYLSVHRINYKNEIGKNVYKICNLINPL